MALKTNWIHYNGVQDVSIQDAYIRIESIMYGSSWLEGQTGAVQNFSPFAVPQTPQVLNNKLCIRYGIYVSQDLRTKLPLMKIGVYNVILDENEMFPVTSGSNLRTAAYEYSKTLPIFSGSVDV